MCAFRLQPPQSPVAEDDGGEDWVSISQLLERMDVYSSGAAATDDPMLNRQPLISFAEVSGSSSGRVAATVYVAAFTVSDPIPVVADVERK